MDTGPATRNLATAINIGRTAGARLDGRCRALEYLQACLDQHGGLRKKPRTLQAEQARRSLTSATPTTSDQSPR